MFDKLLQLLRFGCPYQAIADTTCSATTIRNRRDEWIRLGAFARLKQIALESYDRIVGLVLDQIAVDGSITKAPPAARSPAAHLSTAVNRTPALPGPRTRPTIRGPDPGGAGHPECPRGRRVPVSTSGHDPAKRVHGRKRGLAVDVLGLVIAVVELAANAHDNAAGNLLLDQVAEHAGGTV